MKLSNFWPILIIIIPITIAIDVSAQPADQWYEPKLTYKPAGLPEEKTPEAACKASAAALTKTGQKNEFVSVKAGTTPFAMTCMLRDLNQKPPKVWPQTDNISKVTTCLDKSSSVSWDNSGTFESQKCKCDPAKGCPKGRTGPDEKPAYSCPKQNAANPVCKAKKSNPASADEQKRCTQQSAHTVKTTDVAKQSRENKASQTRDKPSRDASEKYNKALAEIRKDEENKKSVRTGKDQTGNEFPKFTEKDMCDVGGIPTDVNIGSLCGTREEDFAAANNMVGLGKTPSFSNAPNIDCVWHHHEELGRMQLVKRKAHESQPHTGGVKVWQDAFGAEYPLCCP
jgi:hypothetical protein